MRRRNRVANRIALTGLLGLVIGVVGLRAQQIPSSLLDRVSLEQKLGAQVPLELSFRDEAGNTIRLEQYFGRKPVVLALVYYECPMLCTQILNGMVMSFRRMSLAAGRDFEVIAVSINSRETPTLAASKRQVYLEEYRHPGVEGGWHFLTGDDRAIEKLADVVGYRYLYDPDRKQFAHPSGIIVLTPLGIVSRYLYGIEYPDKDLRWSIVEASDNRVGSIVDKILLLCYQYDPMTGKYGLIVMNLLRAGGVVTVVLLGGFMIIMFRKDRRRDRMNIAGDFRIPNEPV